MIAGKYRTIVILVLRHYVSIFRWCYKHVLVINVEYCCIKMLQKINQKFDNKVLKQTTLYSVLS